MRITPAGAGKTDKQGNFHARSWDHPRRCGENRRFEVRKPRRRGSPPQVRGKPGACSPAISTPGITPAGAGKTGSVFSRHFDAGDHPRRCGENSINRCADSIADGSPPQVRGKQCSNGHETRCPGITPAGAGKTCFSVAGAEPQRDHPRRCGENRH